jgi:hypothetical protein
MSYGVSTVTKISEIERMMRDEIREKKRTASGVHHKTGKRGYVGTMRFPSDLLRGKEKREYRKNGKVETYNMYETIMTWAEFNRQPKDRQKLLLEKWREIHPNQEIYEKLGVSHNLFHKKIKELGVEVKRKGGYKVERIRATEAEIKQYKANGIEYQTFINLEDEQFLEVYSHFKNEMKLTNEEFLEILGEDDRNKIYTLNAKAKKVRGRQKKIKKEVPVPPKEKAVAVSPREDLIKLAKEITNTWTKKESHDDDMDTKRYALELIEEEKTGNEVKDMEEPKTAISHVEPVKQRKGINTPVIEEKLNLGQSVAPESVPDIGLNTKLNGEFDSAYLANRLRKLAQLIEGEPNKYRINLKLEELPVAESEIEKDHLQDMKAKKELIASLLEEIV